jgi:hypothetical protein
MALINSKGGLGLSETSFIFSFSLAFLSFILLLVVSTISHLLYRRSPVVIDQNTGKPPPIIGYPTTLPWLFPHIRMRRASPARIRDWVKEGYERYGQHGLPCRLYWEDNLVTYLPASCVDEVANAPEDVIGEFASEVRYSSLYHCRRPTDQTARAARPCSWNSPSAQVVGAALTI